MLLQERNLDCMYSYILKYIVLHRRIWKNKVHPDIKCKNKNKTKTKNKKNPQHRQLKTSIIASTDKYIE
jgi:hypothetical protein